MARLRAKEASGELKRHEQEARDRAAYAVNNPRPVDGLRRAQAARTFYFDPTFTLQSNVVDGTGAVLFPAGTRKNPLEVVSLSKHLLFFDARDPGQVARARELIEHYQGKVKPILVGGSYLDLMKRWNKPVFYDQDGTLVRKFGIAAVPAIVSQEGQRLRIDEVPVR
jgi:conjugal transfer pilus assembly protein TraW